MIRITGQNSRSHPLILDSGLKKVRSYRPRLYTEMERHFAFKINSTLRYNNLKSVSAGCFTRC